MGLCLSQTPCTMKRSARLYSTGTWDLTVVAHQIDPTGTGVKQTLDIEMLQVPIRGRNGEGQTVSPACTCVKGFAESTDELDKVLLVILRATSVLQDQYQYPSTAKE
jgi:hypothetical protein